MAIRVELTQQNEEDGRWTYIVGQKPKCINSWPETQIAAGRIARRGGKQLSRLQIKLCISPVTQLSKNLWNKNTFQKLKVQDLRSAG
jgi:hypothetical protein